jgi:glutathione S-transferase
MKLFFAPGACSMAPHIVLNEAGIPCELEKVNLGKKTTAAGEDYYKINPKGSVPALQLDDGQVLTEVAVLVQYIADRKPETGRAPKAGTLDRYRLMEWINYVSSEVHKTFGPLFNPNAPEEWKKTAADQLGNRFDYLAGHLKDRQYVMGDTFTAVDAYLFTVLNWTHFVKLDLGKWPALTGYMARVADRPEVKKTMKEEGLIKEAE